MRVLDLDIDVDYAIGPINPWQPRTRATLIDKGPFTPAPPDAEPIPVAGTLITGYTRTPTHGTGSRKRKFVAVRIVDNDPRAGTIIMIRPTDIIQTWAREHAAQLNVDIARRQIEETNRIAAARGAQLADRLTTLGIRGHTIDTSRQRIEIPYDGLDQILTHLKQRL